MWLEIGNCLSSNNWTSTIFIGAKMMKLPSSTEKIKNPSCQPYV